MKLLKSLIAAGFILTIPLGVICAITIEFPRLTSFETIGDLINGVLTYLFYLAVIIAPIVILFGAFTIITSAGDAKKYDQGKKIILYALIGFAIIFLAKGIIAFIESFIAAD